MKLDMQGEEMEGREAVVLKIEPNCLLMEYLTEQVRSRQEGGGWMKIGTGGLDPGRGQERWHGLPLYPTLPGPNMGLLGFAPAIAGTK